MEYVIRNGKLRTYGLEIQAAEHCNLRCAGCAQSSPYLSPTFPDVKQLAVSLEHLARVLHPQRVTILGGEPLLNPQLDDLLRVVRAAKMFDRLFITTNGLLLPRVGPSFWELVDTVEISVYPSTKDRVLSTLDQIFEKAWATETEVHLLPTPQFRHITLTTAIPDPQLVSFLYGRCYFRHYCHTVHHGRFYKCGPSTNIGQLLKKATKSLAGSDSGILIDGSPQFFDRLVAYLRDDSPLDACRHCLGSSGANYAHRQLSAKDVEHPERVPFSPKMVSERIWTDWLQRQEAM